MNIIAADVGGTKTHLIYADSNRPDDRLHEVRCSSGDFDSFEKLLSQFIQDSGRQYEALDALSLALPGVINDGTSRLTNLPWTIDRQKLMETFSVNQLYLMNDFQASALGTLKLCDQDFIVLNQATQKPDTIRVVVGAGTGLGLSWIQGAGKNLRAYPTEGGHIDFAPVDAEQFRLLEFLMKTYGHVSYERLLSGNGLVSQYAFLSDAEPGTVDARWINEEAGRGNVVARQTLGLFARIYGAYVGNLAVLFKPEGGIYITGGIGAKIIDWMQSDHFINAYRHKGRMQSLVEQIPVYLVTNEDVGVLGAMSEGLRLLQANPGNLQPHG